MALTHGQVSVATTATSIIPSGVSWRRAYVSNPSGLGNAVRLGGEGVTNTTGFVLDVGDKWGVLLGPGDALFGAAVTGATDIGFMVVEV